ncbi:MAG: DedA family protein [Thermoplasmata archaeon]|nr:DedA family protein [Thermoplasmata archaeon]
MVSIPIIETVVNLITTVMTTVGLPALVALMIVESFGIPPLPSEIILPFAGFLVWSGQYSFGAAVVAAVLGGVIGSYLAYAVGRYGRHLVVGTGALKLDPKHLASMDRWFAQKGEGTVLVARLIPIIRSYISYPAGTARMEPVRFGAYTAVGATPFTVALIYAGVLLGKNWSNILPYFRILDYFAAVIVVGGLLYVALRWRGTITKGFPPRLTRSSEPPRPAGDAPP